MMRSPTSMSALSHPPRSTTGNSSRPCVSHYHGGTSSGVSVPLFPSLLSNALIHITYFAALLLSLLPAASHGHSGASASTFGLIFPPPPPPPASTSAYQRVLFTNQSSLHCLDGSPPGYYLRTSQKAASNTSWIIHFRHGGWCTTLTDCTARTATDFGTSRFTMDPAASGFDKSRFSLNWFQGLLSANRSRNPMFYSWNVAQLIYCDGGLFAGTAGAIAVNGSTGSNSTMNNGTGSSNSTNTTTYLYSEGDNIWRAIFQDLLSRGLADARSVLVSGASAGGQAAALRCDEVAASLPRAKVKCIMDGGFFVDSIDQNNQRTFRANAINVTALHKSALHPACLRAVSASSRWKCWFPSFFLRFVSSPVYIINSDIDPTALVIGKQLDNYSDACWQCIHSITRSRGNRPFCSAASFHSSPLNASASAAVGRRLRARLSLGPACSESVSQPYNSLALHGNKRWRSAMASTTSSSSTSSSSSSTSSKHMSSTASRSVVAAGCSSGSQAAVNAYGKQVCSSVRSLLVSNKKVGAFIVGRPFHAMAIYDSWTTVMARGKPLPAALLSWWQYTRPRALMPV